MNIILCILSLKMDISSVILLLSEIFASFDEYDGVFILVATSFLVQFVKTGMRQRDRNRKRNREFALNEMNAMSDVHFKRMFRMSRATFEALEDKLLDLWGDGVNDVQAIRSSGSQISLRTRLACTLRWLAGGSYIDICFEFGVAPGSFFGEGCVLWGTMDMLDKSFEIGFPFHDEVKLRNIASGFAAYSHNKMVHCVLAIDGWVCRTRCPTASEVKYPMSFRNRHDCFGIVVLAGCDSALRFLMFSCVSAGATNDVLAWTFTSMKRLLDSNALPLPFYFIGDEAFNCTDQFLVPWSGRGLPLDKDSFNFHLSSMRQCIERAFALLTNRWGVFWRPLVCAQHKWTLVCTVAAKLHNYCIDMADSQPNSRHDHDHQTGDEPLVYMNNRTDDEGDEGHRRPTGTTRANITAALERDQIYRP